MSTNKKEYARAYYEAHKEHIKEYYREYNKKRRMEKLRAEAKANPWLFNMSVDYATPTREDFQAVSPEKKLTYSQKYYAENRERIREQQRQKRADDKRKEKARKYYAEHREHLCEVQRQCWARKQRKKRLSKTALWRMWLKIEKIFS